MTGLFIDFGWLSDMMGLLVSFFVEIINILKITVFHHLNSNCLVKFKNYFLQLLYSTKSVKTKHQLEIRPRSDACLR
jgi:hypothetical protein